MLGHDVFEIMAPAQWVAPVVFNSPHSGGLLPAAFLAQSRLQEMVLRASEDSFVDELFANCTNHGAPLLRALISRSFIDLNREPYELDQRMFSDPLPGYMNTTSPRVACGLGTIPRIVAESREIYRGRMPLANAMQRIEQVYRPYHRALATLLNEAHSATGQVLLVDCHSMPSSAVSTRDAQRGSTIDVVIGDRFGAACDPRLADEAERRLASAGLRVLRNRPYAGGFITETHGLPHQGRHALQIEVNRALYMDEARQEKHAGFDALRIALDGLISGLAARISEMAGLAALPMAAE